MSLRRIARLFLRGNWRHRADLIKSLLFQRSPLREGMPWLSWPCIEFLEKHLVPGMRVFEYGGGGSTIFFLRHGCCVTTVEADPTWAANITRRAQELGCSEKLDLRLIDTNDRDPEAVQRYVEEIRNGGPWDLVLVDGARRLQCVEEAHAHVARPGLLLLDNTDRVQYADGPSRVPGAKVARMQGLGFGRAEQTETSVITLEP